MSTTAIVGGRASSRFQPSDPSCGARASSTATSPPLSTQVDVTGSGQSSPGGQAGCDIRQTQSPGATSTISLTRALSGLGQRPAARPRGMKALTWHGKRDVRVDNVPDPELREPTDAIIRVTSSGICGSDLHLYEILSPFLEVGDSLGHERMRVVEAAGSNDTELKHTARVEITFRIASG